MDVVLVSTVMLTTGDEENLLADIKEGIQIAMYRRGDSADDVDPIKVNKLAYFAIQDLDVPVTYGWYKYGPAPVFDTETARVEPAPQTAISAPDEPRIPDPRGELYSPEEYALYFKRDCIEFDRILETPTKEYLREFYEDHAPEPYGDLYENSIQVQVILDDIKDSSDWHTEADDYYKSLNRHLGELYRALLAIDHLNEVVEEFNEYSRLLKDVIAEASTLDTLSPAQQRYIGRVVDLFYGSIWNYVALLISKNTVALSPGNNQPKLLNSIDRDLRELRSSVGDEIKSLRRQSAARDLLPEYYPEIQEYDPEMEADEQTINPEPWTKASTEALTRHLESNQGERGRERE